jgi:hypothetical protein
MSQVIPGDGPPSRLGNFHFALDVTDAGKVMTGKMGPCGLCQQTRQLKNSHLLPQALYKMAREESRKNPNPVLITKGRSFTNSKQVTASFLCAECEYQFSRGGERYVLEQCARPSGDFKIRALLENATPFFEHARFRAFDAARLPELKAEQYLYFAASIFWRAAARTWRLDSDLLKRLSLGSTYQEQLRLYLLGDAGFPKNGRIFMHVWSDEQIDFTFTLPYTPCRVSGAWWHKFCIPGITFIFFLGGAIHSFSDAGALNGTQGQCIYLCRWQDDSLFWDFATTIAQSPPTGELGRRREAG